MHGLCISHERIIHTVVRSAGARSGFGLDVGREDISLKSSVRTCEITAILVIFGLPQLKTGAVIAHEAMHAYLRLSNAPPMDLVTEEGLCQLMAVLWLEGGWVGVRRTLSKYCSWSPSVYAGPIAPSLVSLCNKHEC